MAKSIPPTERFWSKVDKRGPEDCWLWTAARRKNGMGYGTLWVSGQQMSAHCASWDMHNGLIPKGLCVLHECDNPICVNPKHLFLGTHSDNAHDRHRKGRSLRGGDAGNAKLTENDVQMIRDTYTDGGITQPGLARFFGVSTSLIQKILRGELWSHSAPPTELRKHERQARRTWAA